MNKFVDRYMGYIVNKLWWWGGGGVDSGVPSEQL